MPFTMTNFQPLSAEQASPMSAAISGALKGFMSAPDFYKSIVQAKYAKPNAEQDLLTKQIENQLNQVKAKYADSMAQQDLQNKILTNQWYGPEKQSEIGLRGAQTNLMGQQSKWYGPNTQSEINLRKAQTQNLATEQNMNQMKLDYIRQAINPAQSQYNQAAAQTMQQSPNNVTDSGQNLSPGQPLQQMMQPQSNAVYGVESAVPTREDNINKMIFGIDSFTPKLTLSKEQQAQQLKLYQDDIANSIVAANKALEQKQELALFNNAMNRSTYKGQSLGQLPSRGALTTFMGNMSPEQEADQAANKMTTSAIAELTDVMGRNHFSNLDMKAAQSMKFSRSMNDETRNLYTALTNGTIARSQEKVKFLTAMSDPQVGPQKRYADDAWRSYQEAFPLTQETKKGFEYKGADNLNKWPIFTTPKAIESIKKNGFYVPTKAEREATYMLLPDTSGQYHIMPIKPKDVGEAVKHGAMPL